LRADQANFDAQILEPPRSVVCRAEGLHCHNLGLELPNRCKQVSAIQLGTVQCAPVAVNAVQLEDSLGQIDSENGNLHDGPPVKCG
jgi:hypothetical protein